ncbi:MAG: hypothetical protein KBT11_03330 [Treponema sp.]|nr:hypothetical protein [Candidatus Treponema equifaecale]
MDSNVRIVQNINPLSKLRPAATITNGSKVAGRVLAQNSDGTYSVSLAGQKINVRTEVKLQPGQAFTARTEIKNGTVFLALEGTESRPAEILSRLTGQTVAGELNQQTQNFLTNLGMEPNQASFKLIQFMQQMGMKINVAQAKKALNAAKKFSKDEDEAASASILLQEKELPDDEDSIRSIIGGNSQERQENRENQNSDNENVGFSGMMNFNFDENSGKSFVKKFLDSVDEASSKSRTGILTEFNTIRNHKSYSSKNYHWFLLPFEWPVMNAVGDIRVFFDSEDMDLKKIIIKCKKNVQISVFMLKLNNNKIDSVRFSLNSVVSDSVKADLTEALLGILNRSESCKNLSRVEFVQFDQLKGFCTEDTEVATFEGML